MNIDQADEYIHDYMEYIKQFIKKEQLIGMNEDTPSITVILPSMMKIALKIAKFINVPQSVKYLAIQTYNNFMRRQFWKIYNNANHMSQAAWYTVYQKICEKAKFYLIICFHLAVKMNARRMDVSIFTVLQVFNDMSTYKKNVIAAYEFEVLKMINFNIPNCTPYNCIEIILSVLSLNSIPDFMKISQYLLDFFYLKYTKIYTVFKSNYLTNNNVNKENADNYIKLLKLNLFHQGAVIIHTTTFFFEILKKGKLLPILAQISNTKETDISDMARSLFHMVTQQWDIDVEL